MFHTITESLLEYKLIKQRAFISVVIFTKLSKNKVKVRGATVLRQSPLGKFKAYYSDCPKKVCKHLRNIDTLSYELFSEARKLLIQYFPIINYSEKIFLVPVSIDVRE